MTKTNKEKILEKIQLLEEYLEYLEVLSRETKEKKKEFIDDFHFFGLAERYLQLAIQTLIDTVQLVIIAKNLKKPDGSQEAIALLCDKKILSEELTEKLQGIVGFRNILVHEYGKINKEQVYNYLQNNISDLKEFKKEILFYISEK